LNAEVVKLLALPDARKVLLAAGLEPVPNSPAPNSPAQMRRIIEDDSAKWGQMIQAMGLKAE
jgi:hypothetical protein